MALTKTFAVTALVAASTATSAMAERRQMRRALQGGLQPCTVGVFGDCPSGYDCTPANPDSPNLNPPGYCTRSEVSESRRLANADSGKEVRGGGGGGYVPSDFNTCAGCTSYGFTWQDAYMNGNNYVPPSCVYDNSQCTYEMNPTGMLRGGGGPTIFCAKTVAACSGTSAKTIVDYGQSCNDGFHVCRDPLQCSAPTYGVCR